MKKTLIYLLLPYMLCCISESSVAQNKHLETSAPELPIIPKPLSLQINTGNFELSSLTVISFDKRNKELNAIGKRLSKKIKEVVGINVPVRESRSLPKENTIYLSLKNVQDTLGTEGYALTVNPNGIVIRANNPAGIFYGVQTIGQLMAMAEITEETESVTIPAIEIVDKPQLSWRGIMLDESRHFFGKKTVKEILDWMAFYKLNRFHWHLTDAHGWRIEIKQFPRLSTIGGIGNQTNPSAPSAYYTQDDIKEIVDYARKRYIEIIPEIDMPGHATAANRAYPEYSGGGTKKRPHFTFNPGKEETYAYLTKILKEVNRLFPSEMIHIGGDEVHYGNEKWKTDKDVLTLMKKNNLPNIKAVETYFIERMADSVLKLGEKVLGWDEIVKSDLPKNKTIIFWWRHNKPEILKKALKKGYSVVLGPRIPLYFDFVQDSSHISGRKWDGNFSSLKKVYYFSPEKYPEIIDSNNEDLILGIQAHLWTATMSSIDRLEYMLFPRIGALAEAAWTIPEKRDYSKFKTRLAKHLNLYQKAGLKYYNFQTPQLTPEIIDILPKEKN